ncbi:MAG: hypothetical protein K2X00_13660 [Nitrospiraceae bacterium]|nr:hypothetical protein [Nitrospiraceae bacterium]
MRLQDCDLDVTGIVTRPLVKGEPEEEWVEAKTAGVIPPALYYYYSEAKFFSFRSSPRFLADTGKILFPYVGALARGILESLRQAEELTKDILDAHEKAYTPLKKAKGKSWDPKASERALRCFKYLVVELNGALDQFAEIVAIYFHGEDLKLSPGRTSFEDLRKFVLAPLKQTKVIISPRFPLVQKLHSSLAIEIVGKGQEKEWYELMLLYRNKLAHLGNAMFVRMSFPEKGGDMFSFLPNRWPLIFETEITTPGEHSEGTAGEFALERLVHQDIIEYSQGLVDRVQHVLDCGFLVICEAHRAYADYDVDCGVLRSIKKHSRAYEFRAFENLKQVGKTK